jgi:hypothetical protein
MDLFPPGAKRLGIEPVSSISEALQYIEAMLSDAPKATFVSRLRSMIGR